ncbi:MAG: hypothetical protein HYX95_03255 [Chloroflexi bacterium]|nr:hypothetical protein [Chloroflexota bacterium]
MRRATGWRRSAELRSRFSVKTRQVARQALVLREGVADEEALGIADLLDGRTQDVQDAIRVARLASQVGVARAAVLLGLLEP